MSRFFVFLGIALSLIIVQTIVSDVLFLGTITVEFSLIVILYAGFHFDVLRGGLLSACSGFFLDCMSGVVSGFFILVYLSLYLIAVLASRRVVPEHPLFITAFCFLCVFFEALIILILHSLVYEGNAFENVTRSVILQAIIVSVISPALFRLFTGIETVWERKSVSSVE